MLQSEAGGCLGAFELFDDFRGTFAGRDRRDALSYPVQKRGAGEGVATLFQTDFFAMIKK
jgi:hypothetical protein